MDQREIDLVGSQELHSLLERLVDTGRLWVEVDRRAWLAPTLTVANDKIIVAVETTGVDEAE